MTIWDVLEIPPDADKRTIRRAYAAKSKVIHPEEKPEEFQMLYHAYQAAMRLAEAAGKGGNMQASVMEEKQAQAGETAEPEGSGEPERKFSMETDGEEELLNYFEEQNRLEQERLAEALEYLKNLWRKFREQEEKEKLLEYVHSPAFRSIQWHPQVVSLLVKEFPSLSYSRSGEAWKFLWDLYGFQKEQKPEYGQEVRRLWTVLDSARKQWEQDQADRALYEKKRQADIRLEEALHKIGVTVGILAAVLLAVLICYCVTGDQRYIAEEMAEKYPGISFSKPERGEKDESGTRHYHFTSSAHPDMEITAYVKRGVHNSEYSVLIEDYGAQVLGYYAEQYGYTAGAAEDTYQWDTVYKGPGILYYPAGSLKQLEEFCENTCEMFQEQEELQALGAVGICVEDARYKEMMMMKGRAEDMFSEVQIFEPGKMTAEELMQKVQGAYIAYMFSYEPWRLTLQEYRELGPVYEKMWSGVDGQGERHELYISGERICDLYITARPTEILVGDAYYYLLLQGADVSISEDGTGFDVLSGEEWIHFGEEPYLKFHELEWYFGAYDEAEENLYLRADEAGR